MKSIRHPSHYTASSIPLRFVRKMYYSQKYAAKERSIEFLLSFIDWLVIWEISGKLDERGSKRDQYVMGRYGDIGPYAWWNVYITKAQENAGLPHKGKKKSAITRARISAGRRKIVKSKLTDEQILQIRKEHIAGVQGRNTRFGASALSKKFGVSPSTIKAVTARTYHVYRH